MEKWNAYRQNMCSIDVEMTEAFQDFSQICMLAANTTKLITTHCYPNLPPCGTKVNSICFLFGFSG